MLTSSGEHSCCTTKLFTVCSDNLKTKVSLEAHNLYTALIIPSCAHNLCGLATQQSAMLARSSECIVAEKHVS